MGDYLAKTKVKMPQRTQHQGLFNGHADFVRRLALWAIQGLVGCFMFVLWSELKDMRSQYASLASAQTVRGERFVQLEGIVIRLGQDISEMRSSLRQIETSQNDMRLQVEKLRPK